MDIILSALDTSLNQRQDKAGYSAWRSSLALIRIQIDSARLNYDLQFCLSLYRTYCKITLNTLSNSSFIPSESY